MYRYRANRGGHAPGHLREAFCELVETGEMPETDFWFDGNSRSKESLLGQLWNCTDIMSSFLCQDLDLPPGSTYAKGVRSLKTVERKKEMAKSTNVVVA